MCLKPCSPACEKKEYTCQISVHSEQLEKYASLQWSPSIVHFVLSTIIPSYDLVLRIIPMCQWTHSIVDALMKLETAAVPFCHAIPSPWKTDILSYPTHHRHGQLPINQQNTNYPVDILPIAFRLARIPNITLPSNIFTIAKTFTPPPGQHIHLLHHYLTISHSSPKPPQHH